ncbi:MAG: glycosyltransferase family 2 protein [Elusimicrobiota bacterium]
MMQKLVTVIMPCFNQLKYTKMCFESIVKYTNSPCELIVIDNGSRDRTRQYLQNKMQTRKELGNPLVTLKVVNNKNNRGVSAAINQGIALARGQYVCYINNDTIVSHSWLKNLISCAESDSTIGIVGCTTNLVTNVRRDFPDVEGLMNIDEIRRTGLLLSLINNGLYDNASFVHGFCMFIKRKVIKTIGLFDESYFPCAGEDIDYSYRALNAGFRLVNARDVFVFHFWSKATTSRHFNNAYKNLEDIKMRAQKIFISKWGNAGRAFMESNQILRK